MLTILLDPAGATGRQRHAWDYSRTLQENIALHLQSGADCELHINGLRVDPLTEPRMDRPPCALDHVTVIRRPGFGIDLIYWAIAVAAVSAVVAIALMPQMSAAPTQKDSPNNRLTAQTNAARAYQAIPDVYGFRRVWPDMIQPSTVQYVNHVKMVTEWLCISRGRGDISAVQYADTPIDDVAGANYTVFEPTPGADGYPEHGTTTLTDVIETFESPDVNGQELAYVRAPEAVDQACELEASEAESFSLEVGPAFFGGDEQLAELRVGDTISVTISTIPPEPPEGEEPEAPVVLFSGDSEVLAKSAAAGSVVHITFSGALSAGASVGDMLRAQIGTGDEEFPEIAGPFSLPTVADRIRWNTVFLRGLKGSVQIKAEWWQIDGGGAEIDGTRETQTDTYSADTYDARYWTTEVTPAAGRGRYRVQFERLTVQQDDSGADVAKLEEVYAVRHYPQKVMPGVTVIRLTTQATEQATGYSERKFNLRWQRHVRALVGSALGPSRNALRAMAHVWTLAGNDISELDTDTLAAINAEHGEDSPLLRCDVSLDDADMSLGERLQLLANHARCVVWRDGTRWTVTRDQARTYPELQLDYRNLAAGGDSAVSYAAHLPASHDGVELEYVDEASQSKKGYIRLRIDSGSPVEGAASNPLKVQLLGCATQAQAMNRAQLEARRLLHSRVSVQDTALGDAAQLGLGALVRWIDPADFDGGDDGLQAGEVLAVDGDTILTSEPLEWSGSTVGRMLLTGTDGRHLGAPVLCYPAPGGARLATVPDGLYVADGTTMQCGSRYAFAVGLTDAELEAAGLYTATSIKPAGDGSVSVTLQQYDARTYAYDDAHE